MPAQPPEAHQWRTQKDALSHRKRAGGRPGRFDGDGGNAIFRYLRLSPPQPPATGEPDERLVPRDETALMRAIRNLARANGAKRFRVPLTVRAAPRTAKRPPRVQHVQVGDRWLEVFEDDAGVYQVRELPAGHRDEASAGGTNVPESTDLQH